MDRELEVQNNLTLSFFEYLIHIKRFFIIFVFLPFSLFVEKVPLAIAYFVLMAVLYRVFPLRAYEKDALFLFVVINLFSRLLDRLFLKLTKLAERFMTW